MSFWCESRLGHEAFLLKVVLMFSCVQLWPLMVIAEDCPRIDLLQGRYYYRGAHQNLFARDLSELLQETWLCNCDIPNKSQREISAEIWKRRAGRKESDLIILFSREHYKGGRRTAQHVRHFQPAWWDYRGKVHMSRRHPINSFQAQDHGINDSWHGCGVASRLYHTYFIGGEGPASSISWGPPLQIYRILFGSYKYTERRCEMIGRSCRLVMRKEYVSRATWLQYYSI